MSKGNVKKFLLKIFCTIILFFSACIILGIYQMLKHSVPKNVKTITQFIEKTPTPKYAFTFDRDEKTFVVFVGDMPTFPIFPSGDPIYIFNGNGQIIYWTIDSGDTESDWLKVISKSEQKEISINEAFQVVSDKKRISNQ